MQHRYSLLSLKVGSLGLLIILAFLFQRQAYANTSLRNSCKNSQLEKEYTLKLIQSLNIEAMKKSELNQLSSNFKAQLIQTAKLAFQNYSRSDDRVYRSSSDIKTVVDAVDFIRQTNESRDEEIQINVIQSSDGKRWSKVTFYPGAQVGYVYPLQSIQAIAEISDGDLMCF
jgi:hypothetical protein